MNKLIIALAAAVAGVLILVLGAVKGVLKAPFKGLAKLGKLIIAPFKKLFGGKSTKNKKQDKQEEPEPEAAANPNAAGDAAGEDAAPATNTDPAQPDPKPEQKPEEKPEPAGKTEEPLPGGKDDPDNAVNAEQGLGKDKPAAEEPAGTSSLAKQDGKNGKDAKQKYPQESKDASVGNNGSKGPGLSGGDVEPIGPPPNR